MQLFSYKGEQAVLCLPQSPECCREGGAVCTKAGEMWVDTLHPSEDMEKG